MTIVLHDFSGHPFQAELSRQLAGMGNQVDHVFAEQYVSGKGHLSVQPGDAGTLTFTGLRLDLSFQKYAPLERLRFERAYGRRWIERIKQNPPDSVVACNIPLVSMFMFARFAKRNHIPYVFWHQDIYSLALAAELRRRLPRPFAAIGARVLARMESYCARAAHHVVAIGDAFLDVYPRWKVDPSKVSVIPNWAPLDKVFPVARNNSRSAHLFDDDDTLRLVYAGTLGRKHNPDLLIDLIRGAQAQGIPVSLVVISAGESADYLAEQAAQDPQLPLKVLPFQPAEDLSDVLSSADVLIALLEPDATMFSIPSKVLSYMAAGRPILGLMPADNPAAADIIATGGHVATPDAAGASRSVAWLAALDRDRDLITSIGKRAREIAEQKFDITKVGEQFENILADAVRASELHASEPATPSSR